MCSNLQLLKMFCYNSDTLEFFNLIELNYNFCIFKGKSVTNHTEKK